jgi:hypothetical protein
MHRSSCLFPQCCPDSNWKVMVLSSLKVRYILLGHVKTFSVEQEKKLKTKKQTEIVSSSETKIKPKQTGTTKTFR